MVSNNPLDNVIESSKYVNENNKLVKINRDKIIEFLKQLSKDDYESKSSVVQFPLNFTNPQQEINFWFILDLLNFGSGYRKELHQYSKRGAYETICYGLFGMYLSQSGNLNVDFLSKLSLNEVSSYFSLETQVEFEIQPGIYSYKDSTLKPLCLQIQSVLKESCEEISTLGYKDFASFVWKITDPAKATQPPQASIFIEKILEVIPAFRDIATHGENKHKVYLYKKVQLLAADLYRRFKDTLPERFAFTDIDRLSVFTDNVLPTVLRYYGILELNKELEEQINAGTELEPGSDQEVELRSQAIEACKLIVETSNELKLSTFIKNQMELDYYIWTKGKDPEIRKVERHVCKKTIFY